MKTGNHVNVAQAIYSNCNNSAQFKFVDVEPGEILKFKQSTQLLDSPQLRYSITNSHLYSLWCGISAKINFNGERNNISLDMEVTS